MARQFFVIERTPCATCHGQGFVTNPAWIPWPFSGDPFTDTGDDVYEGYAKRHGPEEVTCGECEGRCKFEREVAFTDALDHLRVWHREGK